MTALEKSNFIAIGDYLAGEEIGGVKNEYIGGAIHAMAGATNRHNTISGNASGLLFGQLRGKSRQPFNSDTKVRIEFPDHTRFYYPDSMVVCEPDSGLEHHTGLENLIPLPEMEASWLLGALYERVEMKA